MIEAIQQAFEVPLVEQLESVPTDVRLVIDDADGMGTRYIPVGRMCHDASKAIRQAIAEAEKQEPVAQCMVHGECFGGKCIYPQTKREWVGLTPQERDAINKQVFGAVPHHVAYAHAIEQALKKKNT